LKHGPVIYISTEPRMAPIPHAMMCASLMIRLGVRGGTFVAPHRMSLLTHPCIGTLPYHQQREMTIRTVRWIDSRTPTDITVEGHFYSAGMCLAVAAGQALRHHSVAICCGACMPCDALTVSPSAHESCRSRQTSQRLGNELDAASVHCLVRQLMIFLFK